MRIFYLLTILVTFLLISAYLIFDFGTTPDEWDSPPAHIVGKCSEDSELHPSIADINLPTKSIVLTENLVASQDGNNCHMWETYKKVAKYALHAFMSEHPHPTYNPKIIFSNQIYTETPRTPFFKIEAAAKTDALIVVGFAWSTDAKVAGEAANHLQIPFIAPTAVIKDVHESQWTASLGLNLDDATEGFVRLKKSLGLSDVIIVEGAQNVQEREYSDAVQKKIPNTKVVLYHESYPFREVEDLLELSPNALVFIPGYTHSRHFVRRIHEAFPEATFVVGPQWTHDFLPLRLEFQDLVHLNLYSISDFVNTGTMRPAATYLNNQYTKNGDQEDGGFKYSLFDALYLALTVLNDPNVTTRENVMPRIKNFGKHPFSAKAPIFIKNGKVYKTFYILKWQHDNFTKIKDFDLTPST